MVQFELFADLVERQIFISSFVWAPSKNLSIIVLLLSGKHNDTHSSMVKSHSIGLPKNIFATWEEPLKLIWAHSELSVDKWRAHTHEEI